jgi:hypothetical protein
MGEWGEMFRQGESRIPMQRPDILDVSNRNVGGSLTPLTPLNPNTLHIPPLSIILLVQNPSSLLPLPGGDKSYDQTSNKKTSTQLDHYTKPGNLLLFLSSQNHNQEISVPESALPFRTLPIVSPSLYMVYVFFISRLFFLSQYVLGMKSA